MSFQTLESFPASAAYPAAASFPAAATFPSAYDPDAILYFASTGVTDPTQRLNISQFFTGLKKNGLWNGMTEGWTMRSTQNVGSGTSVKGMKGAYAGVMTNTPTWGVDGITFGANKYIQVSNFFINRPVPFSSFCVSTPNANGTRLMVSNSNNLQMVSYINQSVINNSSTPASSNGIANSAARAAYFHKMSRTQYAVAVNGGAETVTTITAFAPFTGNDLRLAGVEGGGVEPTDMSCFLWWDMPLNVTVFSVIYTLYKNTIGQGLSLP